jgi:hypothetical protein
MTKKRLTKKQLYGYSYMKWDNLRNELRKVPFGLCSFCYESDKLSEENKCKYCQIDKRLCNKFGEESLYSEITQLKRRFYHLVDKMCMELRGRYYNHE